MTDMDHEEITSSQAAAYLGVTRQALLAAVHRGEIGRIRKAPGTRTGYLYMFNRPELDVWKAQAQERQRRKGRKKRQTTS